MVTKDKMIEKQPEPVVQAEPETTAVATTDDAFKSLFKREHVGASHVKGIKAKRFLTKPLVAAAHFKQLLFTALGPMYTMTLPAKGRGAAPTPARVIDGVNVETGEECTLVVNAMIASAFKRAGFAILEVVTNEHDETSIVEVAGSSLVNHSFALRSGNMNEEKGYRIVDVVEVEVTT